MNTHQKKYLAQNVIGGTDVEAETPILWPPDTERWCIWKDPDAGKDWGQEEKGMTEDEMVGWYHRHNGQGFRWTSGIGNGQGGLTCCDWWGRKESDTTKWLNWTELNWTEKHGNVPVRNWKLPLFHISLWIPLELVVMLSSIYLWFVCVCVCVFSKYTHWSLFLVHSYFMDFLLGCVVSYPRGLPERPNYWFLLESRVISTGQYTVEYLIIEQAN